MIGEVLAYGGDTAPMFYLLCDGSAVSRATYKPLFDAIGTTFGVGDGSTTFNLPNMKGRSVFGYSSGDTDHNAIGKTGGVTQISHSHTHAHYHYVSGTTGGPSTTCGGDGGSYYSTATSNHTHTYSLNSNQPSNNTTSTSTVPFVPPYVTTNFIIRHNFRKAAFLMNFV